MANTGEGTSEGVVRRYAVLCGLTPLLPVPLADEAAHVYFARRMLRRLAARRGIALAADDVRALVDSAWGCGPGCLVSVVVYPLKKLFRTLFFFLEWKRAVDVASAAYHFGLLFDRALEAGWWNPGAPEQAVRLRGAIDRVLRRQGTNPVELAFRRTFRASRTALRGGASLLRERWHAAGARVPNGEVESASLEENGGPEMETVAGRLGQELAGVPPGYFEALARQLAAELDIRFDEKEVTP
jgi:hypothetical protein